MIFVGLGIGAVSLVTFVAFCLDKWRARAGGWRISEATLLGLALLGGWPGAKLAQRMVRHKTRKMPFAAHLNRVPLIRLGFAGLIAIGYAATTLR